MLLPDTVFPGAIVREIRSGLRWNRDKRRCKTGILCRELAMISKARIARDSAALRYLRAGVRGGCARRQSFPLSP